MSVNDAAQTPPPSQFDLAIMKALMKNPQGLRYSELHRKSELEYERMGSGKGINVRTFNKHLKWLVSERVLERIEEARYKVYYRLTIPAKLKVYAETSRDHTVSIVNNVGKSIHAAGSQIPELPIELLMNWIAYSVKGALLTGILLWIGDNPVLARYWVDEEIETTRYAFNKMAAVFEKKENIKDLRQLFDRLDHKWSEQLKREIEILSNQRVNR